MPHTFARNRLILFLIAFSFVGLLPERSSRADETPALSEAEKEEQARVKLAVALNYCRASFYRINKYQTLEVLKEEQKQILNNLDLSSIDDAEVIQLYTNVIDEINQIQLVDREKEIIHDNHKRSFRQKLFLNAMSFGTQMATFNYVGAVQSGVGSWWDYRASNWQKENDSWKLEKNHEISLVRKTTDFIETSWKLARTRNIPDAYLIRDNNLAELEEMLAEPDLEKRLRLLRRKEDYFVCYPPYYYYIARIEQSLGRTRDAAETYRKLRDLEQGHFRKDEMLAAGLASLAAIEHHNGHPDALQTAQQSLKQSTDVWEANLVCANILADYGIYDEAEDAVLRNLDVDLERDASRNALAVLYTRSGDTTKLARHLGDEEFVQSLRGPVLLQCALALGEEGLPTPASKQFIASMQGQVNVTFGKDDLVIVASDDWNIRSASKLSIRYGDALVKQQPEVIPGNGFTQIVYRGILEVGTPWKRTAGTRAIAMEIGFPDQPAVAFQLHPSESTEARKVVARSGGQNLYGAQQNGYLITGVRSEHYRLAFDGSSSYVDRAFASKMHQQRATARQNLDPRHPSQPDDSTVSASQSKVKDQPKEAQKNEEEPASKEPVATQGPIELLTPELN